MTSTTLDILTGKARRERDTAGRNLAGAQRACQQLQAQLQQLQGYRREYATRLDGLLQTGTDMLTVQEYQRFLGSIDTALERARQELERQQQELQRCQDHWQQKQQRLASFDTLASRREQQAARAESKRERRLHDEIAQTAFRRRGPNDKPLTGNSG